MPEGLSSISESVIHFLSVANLSHPQEGARYTVPSKGPQRKQIYNKNNSAFSHAPVVKSGGADYFFHKGFVIARSCFRPCFVFEITAFAIFHFYFSFLCPLGH